MRSWRQKALKLFEPETLNSRRNTRLVQQPLPKF